MSERLFGQQSEPLPPVGPDSPHTLYQLSQLGLDPTEASEVANNELTQRIDQHGLLVDELVGDTSDAVRLTSKFQVFGKENGATQPLADAVLEAHNLPEAPAGLQGIAVALVGTDRKQAFLLGINEQGSTEWRKLLDQSVTAGSKAISPEWSQGGSQVGDSANDHIAVETDRDDFLLVSKVSDAPISLLRNEQTAAEKAALDETDTEKPKKWARRVGALALTVSGIFGGLAATGSEVNYDQETPQYTDIEAIDDTAINRFERANEAALAGDQASLSAIIAESEFSQSYVSEAALAELEIASTRADMLNIAQSQLEQFGVTITVPTEATEQLSPLDETDIEAIRAGVAGVLDFANTYGPLMKQGLTIELVDVVPSHGGERSTADGHYDTADPERNEPETIRLSVGSIFERKGDEAAQRIAEVSAHEVGHSVEHRAEQAVGNVLGQEAVASSQIIWALNAENTHYDEQSALNSRSLHVGHDVITDYAATNQKEDLADTFEALAQGEFASFAEADTPLENKIAALMSDLEEEHPGISAVFFEQQLQNGPSSPNVMLAALDAFVDFAETHGNSVALPAAAVFLMSLGVYAKAELQERKKIMQ